MAINFFVKYFRLFLFHFLYMGILPALIYWHHIMFIPGAGGGQNRVIVLGLELVMFVSHHVGARTPTPTKVTLRAVRTIRSKTGKSQQKFYAHTMHVYVRRSLGNRCFPFTVGVGLYRKCFYCWAILMHSRKLFFSQENSSEELIKNL